MKTFLIEAYVGRIHPAELARLSSRAEAAARVMQARGGCRLLRTILLPGDETCLWLVEARAAHDVHSIARTARLHPQRVVEVVTSCHQRGSSTRVR